jgi:hypothetical protein
MGPDICVPCSSLKRGDSVKSRAHVRKRIFQSLLYSTKYAYCTNSEHYREERTLVLQAGPDRCLTTLSYTYRRARIQLEAVISLLRILVIFTFVVAFSDHDIRIPSLSSADSFHVSWDRSLCLWVSLPSL